MVCAFCEDGSHARGEDAEMGYLICFEVHGLSHALAVILRDETMGNLEIGIFQDMQYFLRLCVRVAKMIVLW